MPNPITEKQKNYIAILSIDLNFTRKQRNLHIQDIIGTARVIKDLDQLTTAEASIVIGKFKEWIGANHVPNLNQ